MSGQNASIGSIIGGVAIGIVAVVSQQYWLLGVSVSLIAGGALGLMAPQQGSPERIKGRELELSTSSTGIPVPVVWGEARVVPNITNLDQATFRTEEVRGESSGGKGGGKPDPPVVGHDYFLAWELGVCRGPIDAIIQIFSVPGEIEMMPRIPEDPEAITADLGSSDDTVAFSADYAIASHEGGTIYFGDGESAGIIAINSATEVQIDTTGLAAKTGAAFRIDHAEEFSSDELEIEVAGTHDEGTMRFYRGSATQTRNATNDSMSGTGMNYRGQAFVSVGIGPSYFLLGRNPQPKSYSMVVRRLPRHDSSSEMTRPDGTAISGFPVRASTSIASRFYNQANPAAIAYEIITDDVWGKGIDPDDVNEASFAAAAVFFRTNEIGMSVVMDSVEDPDQFVNSLLRMVRSMITEDDGKLKFRNFLDASAVYSEIETLSRSSLHRFRFTRPLIQGATNVVRAEFTSAIRHWKPDVVEVASTGLVSAVGGKQVVLRESLRGITDWSLARRMATRLLVEQSFPRAIVEFRANRFATRLEPGDVVRVQWDEGGTDATKYLEVLDVSRDGESEEITVSAAEDILLSIVSGLETSTTVPTEFPWASLVDVDRDDVELWSPVAGEILPLIQPGILELPPAVSAGAARLLFLAEEGSANTQEIQVLYSEAGVVSLRSGQAKMASGTVTSKSGLYFDPGDAGKTLRFADDGFDQLYTITSVTGAQEVEVTPAHTKTVFVAAILYGSATESFTSFEEKPNSLTISGVTTTELVDQIATTRDDSFQFTLNDSGEEADLLSAFSVVATDADDFQPLAERDDLFAVIGEELIQVGVITEPSPGVYEAAALLRGRWGSPKRRWASGTKVWFFTFKPESILAAELGRGKDYSFKGYPISYRGVVEPEDAATVALSNYGDAQFVARGILPLTPEFYSIETSGANHVITVRPRWHAGVDFERDFNAVGKLISSSLDAIGFVVETTDAAGVVLEPKFSITPTFSPGEFGDSTKGLAEFTIATASNIIYRVWSRKDGLESERPLIIHAP